MVYGYCRVSTSKQGKDGNSLEMQRQQLTVAGAERIVTDTFTGTKMERPHFTALLKQLKSGDVLTVTKLDRLARTATEGVQTVQSLLARGVAVNVLNMGKLDGSPMGQLILTIMLAFAQFERDMIVERTQSGKAAARAKGVRVDGRPIKYGRAQREHALHLLEDHSYNDVVKLTGIPKATLARYKAAMNAAAVTT
jgi:DNA invertase Pin-like site-specific DNA recombinase